MQAWSLDGLDPLLSTVQMSNGMPVATFAIGKVGAINAATFAVQILAMGDFCLKTAFLSFRSEQSSAVNYLE